MDRDETKHFKEQCALYLTQLSLTDLRTYGRFLNLTAPTRLKKSILIDEIISVLCGEKSPTRTKRGAPIKSKLFQADIPLKIEEIKNKILNKNQLHHECDFVYVQNLQVQQEHNCCYFQFLEFV